MKKLTQKQREERQKVVKAARVFAPLLNNPVLTEEEIEGAIENLRPLRMHIHAIDFGDAPGYRKAENL